VSHDPAKAQAPRARSADPRARLLGALHAAKRSAGLDDDTYRDVLEAVTKKRSAKDLSIAELNRVIDHINLRVNRSPEMRGAYAKNQGTQFQDRGRVKGPARAGSRAMAQGPQAAKIRALWLSLYHLGEVHDPSEAAMVHFVKRQTGQDALEWLEPRQAGKVIDALKSWSERAGYFVPMADDDGLSAKVVLIRAIWAKLVAAGAIRIVSDFALGQLAMNTVGGAERGIHQMQPRELDRVIERLGKWHRSVIAKTAKPDATSPDKGDAP
jgi:phage gp16-like protein